MTALHAEFSTARCYYSTFGALKTQGLTTVNAILGLFWILKLAFWTFHLAFSVGFTPLPEVDSLEWADPGENKTTCSYRFRASRGKTLVLRIIPA